MGSSIRRSAMAVDESIGHEPSDGDPVRPRERQVGTERPVVDGPASRGEFLTHATRERLDLRHAGRDADPQRARPPVRRERARAAERRRRWARRARRRAFDRGDRRVLLASGLVGPRNRRVRCRPSSRTQRTSWAPSGSGWARTASTISVTAVVASSGRGNATNRRRPVMPA